jgi:outer membrane biosynthesis protein TonB
MTSIARSSLAVFVAASLSFVVANPAQAHVVEDLGVRKGAPAHISLSTGFNGFVGAGIKKIEVDGVQMDAFCIDPFTMALHSSPGYRYVPLTQAPEAPWTLNSHQALEISDLWAMFYSPNMTTNKAAGLQLAIWEIVGGDHFTVIGKDYGSGSMLAALQTYSGPGANLIALTGPGQDYVVLTPPGQRPEGNPTPTPPQSTPTPTPPPQSTPTPTPHPQSTPTPPPHSTPTPTPAPTRPPGSNPTPPPGPTPPLKNVPDSGSTLYLLASAMLALLALNKFRSTLPAPARVPTRR